MSHLPKILIVLSALSASAPIAFAHGESGHMSEDKAAGKPGDPKNVTRTVRVGADEYTFAMPQSTFKAGETVKFVVTNKGTLMHEFTIGTSAAQAEHRKMMEGMSDKAHGGMSHDKDMDTMASNAIHVMPGETKELVWTFTQAGTVEYACNFPGHADLGMEGALTVQ